MADKPDLIATIYDAIIDPSCWEEVVKRIVEATKSSSGNVVLQQPGAGSFTAVYNVDPVIADAYAQTYHKNDPLKTPEWSIALGEVRACSYTQTESFKASAYYDEFVRPQGWVNLIVTGLARGPDSFALLALTRSPGAAWVEPPGWHLLETLAPHLARAAAVHALLARSRTRANALSAATGFAVFLLNATCRVLFANAKAEDLMRRQTGLRYEGGRLAAATPALTQRLQELARAGSWPGRGGGEIGGTIELPRGENRPPLLAHVIPLAASRAASVFDIERPAAAVFVVDLVAEMHAQIARFAAKFGLTLARPAFLAKSSAAAVCLPSRQNSTSPRRRRAATRTTFLRKPEPRARRSSSAGFSRPPCSARRAPHFSAKLKAIFRPASKVPLMTGRAGSATLCIAC